MEKEFKLFRIQIGDHLHICDEGSLPAIKVKARKALKSGKVIVLEDGKTEWIEYEPILALSEQGSDIYTWDQTGNRVKCEVVLYTYTKKETKAERRVLKTIFRDFLNV